MGEVIAFARQDEASPSTRSDSPTCRPATTTLAIENMHCGGCMRRIEEALLGLPGVISARTQLASKRVTVSHSGGLSAETLISTLDAAGFRAREIAGETAFNAGRADSDFLRRLGVAGFAAANIMLLSVSVWSGGSGDMDPSVQSLFHWLSALIALPAVAYAGQPFFASALQALRRRRLNMDVPISLGVLLATGMSLYQTTRGSEQVYFDAAVTLLFFLLLGRFLDQRMRTRAAGAAANLLGLRATSATVITAGGQAERVPVGALAPGMRVLVAAGERIPVDGRVESGESDVDESLITGESAPRRAQTGTRVFAGTINLGAPLRIEATAVDQNTLLEEIGRLMQAAEQGRARYVRLADRAARLYAPGVHVLGLSTFIGWLALGHGWEPALTAAVAVLIITCPCALALAVPAVQVAAVSRLFAGGVLVKAPDALERIAEVDTVVFDKTGTLTLAEPELEAAQDPEAERFLAQAASLAAASRHPYARALVRAARARGLDIAAGTDALEVTGAGLSRQTQAGEERLGSASFCGIATERAQDATLCYRPAASEAVPYRFRDRLRADAREVIGRLEASGFHIELLSGDRAAAVETAAAACGIRRWQARQRPSDKIARLEALKAQGRRVLMVGDGLNDAPALAAAHASLSPSTAADISQTTADAIFQGDRLAPVLETMGVARAAQRLAVQNFAIAIGYNALFVPLAMAGYVTPLIAALAMSTSSIAVTANALRLKSHRREREAK
jgi:Cu2+-exporting ATPase